MEKPYLLVVTGRPGAGKTTFAQALGRKIWMPVISRDQLKEGYVHTFGREAASLPETANRDVTLTFFETLHFLVDHGISVIAEAAFQHPLWEENLSPLAGKADIALLICRTDAQLALERFLQRGMADERREYFHGDKGVQLLKQGIRPAVSDYREPQLPYPTFYVDTTAEYRPSLEQLASQILKRKGEKDG